MAIDAVPEPARANGACADDPSRTETSVMATGTGTLVSGLLWRLGIFTLLWWMLTEGRVDALVFGLPFIIIAALLSSAFSGRRRRRTGQGRIALPALGRLIPYFLYHSLIGGIDVAIRAFQRPLPLTPDLVDYPLRLPAGPARVLMAGLVSLMPGTLAVIYEDRLKVHVLDRGGPFRQELHTLERLVGAVFGLRLATPAEQAPLVGADRQEPGSSNSSAKNSAKSPPNSPAVDPGSNRAAAPANRPQQSAPDDR